MTDRTVSFRILSDASSLPAPPAAVPGPTTHWRDGYYEYGNSSSGAAASNEAGTLGDTEARTQLWATKAQLDSIPEQMYYKARNETFPLAVGGSQGSHTFANRAGHKLNEVMEATGIWNNFIKGAGQVQKPSEDDDNPQSKGEGTEEAPRRGGSNKLNAKLRTAFVDLCGGPGSFAQAIFGAYPRRSKVKLVGFGMTLKDPNMADKHNTAADGWYPNLVEDKRFHPTFGVNGEGDIYKMSNIESLASITEGMPMLLAVADGGFEVPSADANYQETISMRLAYCQWHAALCVLQQGGSFVLKLFDTFSPIMRSMLYLTTKFFDSTYIVKPKHSRAVNSERYLAAKGFRGVRSATWRSYLQQIHESAFTDSHMPASLVPVEWLTADGAFEPSVVNMNTNIATNQMQAIQKVMQHPSIQKHLRGDAADEEQPAPADEEQANTKREREEEAGADPREAAEAEEVFVEFV